MKFDLRLPLGILFGFYGVLLAVYGLVSNSEIYERSLGININLIWGVVLLVVMATLIRFSYDVFWKY